MLLFPLLKEQSGMGISVNISYHHSACPIDADFAFLQCGLVKLSSSEKVHSAVNFEVMHVHKIPQHFLPHLLRLALVSTYVLSP